MKKQCVIVEGIPGAGKTYFSRRLAEFLGKDTLFLTEPDDVGDANPYLTDYYSDPAKNAFPMQIHLLQARYKYHKLAQYHTISGVGHSVIDRSFYGDVGFAFVQKQMGFFSEREYNTYESLFHIMASNILYPSVCVYVNVNSEVAIERIKRRMENREGRKCEVKIDTRYLDMVGNSIEVVLRRLDQFGVNIIRVDWNKDRDEFERDVEIRRVAELISYSNDCNMEFCNIYNRVI